MTLLRLAGWIVAPIACVALALSASAQCTYTPLVSGVAVATSAEPQLFSFNQGSVFYSAVAIRPAAGEDWNLEVYQSTDVNPACVAAILGTSARPAGVDFVLGDFNTTHNPIGLHYPRATRMAGVSPATVEWDDGPTSLTVNGPLVSRTTGATDVIEVWDVNLSAGVSYTFDFDHTGADLKLLLFKSGPGAYWAGRDAALFEVTADHSFTPPSGGFHGVVVVNDDGAAGTYTLGIGTCDSPTALAAGTTVTTSRAEKYYSFGQFQPFWTALGVRGTSNWQLAAYGAGSGTPFPGCLGDSIISSNLPAPTVDFVVGNFNEQTTGTRYARVFLEEHKGSGTATVEWDDGADILTAGDPPINRSTGATDVLEVWDVYLEAALNYNITFNTTGANLRLFLFPPTTMWAGRSGNVFEISGSANPQLLDPSLDGWHGLVVVNEDGASGSYTLGIGASVVGVEDAGPVAATEFKRIAPNPARGGTKFLFALRDAGTVGFRVVNVAGRVVAELPPQQWKPGYWTASWDGRSSGGVSVASGVYFVYMTVGDQVISRQKLVLLQ